jgi:hypothetical protein
MPQPRWLVVGLSRRRTGLDYRPVHETLLVDKLALGQDFLQLLRLSPISNIPTSPSTICIVTLLLPERETCEAWETVTKVGQ